MPHWGQVLQEIQAVHATKDPAPMDTVRRKYLALLAQKRGRNVIAYYSGWLQNPGPRYAYQASINDADMNAFMAVMQGLDRKKGLDILLHTPGGGMSATESLINYLHKMFDGNIEAFVPQIAMSAGTMIACCCKKIHMGKQSSIGPIDPQINGVPAYGVIKEFKDALVRIKKDSAAIPLWQVIIGKYHPTLLGECRNAINLAREIVRKRLEEVMFFDEPRSAAARKAKKIVNCLNEHNKSNKVHDRHIDMTKAAGFGLKIEPLEQDNELQDLVLTVHHCYIHAFSSSIALKITENHRGTALINSASPLPLPRNA